MSRMTNTLRAIQREMQSLDISSIEKASFLLGDQYSPHGNPLHSTALGDDICPLPEQSKTSPEKTSRTQTGKAFTPVVNKKKAATASNSSNKNAASKENQATESVVRKVKGSTLATTSKGREDILQRKASVPVSSKSKKGGAVQRSEEEKSPTSRSDQGSQNVSSEELTDEDDSFRPSKERSKGRRRTSFGHRLSGHKQKRKSSSSSERANLLRNPTDLNVVLDAFQEFVSKYKETINSAAVNRCIDSFSRSVEGQMGKVKLQSLQKDLDEMEQRFKALTEGSSLLHNLKELNTTYMAHRLTNPDQLETYGLSCMPAMLMEARCIMGTEHQLKNINDALQQIVEDTEG
ncbi:hypothetical protein DNTS_018565 [Danionella cerebrum]|uniref:Centromere protein U n=1 Tax=Danionella cerebrum TaxID=2873325 RepID=A0A553QIS3_9TELE|nr:hypothetical protein DNTS_018565 [Danionella translucida]